MPPAIKIIEERVLSNNWYLLKTTAFDLQRRDGSWQRQHRETYDRGNGATILLYNRSKGTVILTRQFRFPAYVNGTPDGMLTETCASWTRTTPSPPSAAKPRKKPATASRRCARSLRPI
jgi:hypothetical protein